MISSKFLSLSLGFLISLHVLCVINPAFRSGDADARTVSAASFLSEAKSSLDSIREGITGTARFVERVSRFFEMVVYFAGFRAIVLLLAVLIIASVFSFMGIPRGVFSFFLSLLCADALWMAWHKSFQVVEWDFIFTMAKTNLILAAPFLAVSIITALFRPVVSKTGFALRGLMGGILPSRTVYSRDKLVDLLELYRENSIELEKSLLQDIIDSGSDKAVLSNRSKRLAVEVLRITGKIGGKSGGAVAKVKAGTDDVK